MSEYEVVWSGGELLPPRDSVKDSRWQRIPSLLWEMHEPRPPENVKLRKALKKTKRMYNKQNQSYWKRRGKSES